MPEKFYSTGYDLVEDYKLWVDISRNQKVWNLPDYLIYYRIHPKSATNVNSNKLYLQDIRIYKYLFEPLKIEIDPRKAFIHLIIKNNQTIYDKNVLKEIEAFLVLILNQNETCKVYNQDELTKVVFERWLKVCYKSRGLKMQTLKAFLNSSLFPTYLKTVL